MCMYYFVLRNELFTNFQVCDVYPLAINVIIVNVLASSSDSLKIILSENKYFQKCNSENISAFQHLSKQLKDRYDEINLSFQIQSNFERELRTRRESMVSSESFLDLT